VTPEPVAAPVAASSPSSAPIHQGPPRVDLASFWRMQHAAASMRAAKLKLNSTTEEAVYLALLDTKNRVLDTEKEIDKAKKLADRTRTPT